VTPEFSPFRTSISRRGFLGGVSALALTGLLTACGGGSSSAKNASTGSTGAVRDSLIILTPDQATNVVRDYGYTAGTDNQDVTNNLHAQLIKNPYITEKGSNADIQDVYSFKPYLASGYDVSADGLTITFHLNKGVISHQGNELTSADVVWSFARKFATPGGGMAGYYKPMLTDPATQIVAVDPYTVTIKVAKASYVLTLLGNMANNIGSIYDSTYLKLQATPADPYAVAWGVADIMRGNVGFGAYELSSVTAGQEIVMTSNEKFVLGAPKIKKQIRRVVADAATRASILKSGDADIALALRPADQVTMLKNTALFIPTTTTNFYMLASLNTKLAPFDNELVRQAFAYAIPYDQINQDVFFGRAYAYTHMLDDKAPHYDASKLPAYKFDVTKAKALLKQAGMPDGFAFTLTVNNSIPSIQDTAIQIQSYAKQAGIIVTIAQEPAAQLNTDSLAGKLQASLSQGSSVTMSPPYELQLLTQPGGGSNSAHWQDDADSTKFQQLVASGLDAGDANGAPAAALWSQAETLMMTAAPYVFINRVRSAVGMKSDIKGFVQRTDFRVDYSNLSIG
jgi:peptide/nickel transport system substrate-binding protein